MAAAFEAGGVQGLCQEPEGHGEKVALVAGQGHSAHHRRLRHDRLALQLLRRSVCCTVCV